MRKLMLIFGLAVCACAQVTITGTIRDARNTVWSGRIQPKAIAVTPSAYGPTVMAPVVVTNGVLSTTLNPGTYSVTYTDAVGRAFRTATWTVPGSGPVVFSDIESGASTSPIYPFAYTLIAGLSKGDLLVGGASGIARLAAPTDGTYGLHWAAGVPTWGAGLGNVENVAISTWTGSTNLATVGTVSAGTWHATPLSDNYVASAAAWNGKAPTDSPTFTGNVTIGARVLSGITSTSPVIVFDGDSLTAGWNGTTNTNWPVNSITPPNGYTVANVAVGGQTVTTIKANAPAHVDALYRPAASQNIVVIWAGVNDIITGSTAAATYELLRAYCLARRAVGWTVVVGTMISQTSHDAQKNSYNDLIRAGWPGFADAIADYASDPRIGADLIWAAVTSDGTHLSDYAPVAAIAQAAINSVVASAPSNLGANVATNGTFAADANWTKGANWAISGGVASATAGAGLLYQNLGLTNGVKYKVTFDITAISAGGIRPGIGGASDATATTQNYDKAGTFTAIISAASGANGNFVITPAANFSGSIDNVTVTPILGSGTVRGVTKSCASGIVVTGGLITACN